LLKTAGFHFRVELLPRLFAPSTERYDFLLELELTEKERSEIMQLKRSVAPEMISHLPYFLVIADKP
jgi:hypothetical protein